MGRPHRTFRLALVWAIAAAPGCTDSPPSEPDPPFAPEAGFVELPPHDFAVRGGEVELTSTTSRARLFFSFQPAREDPQEKPLFVMHSGGPGASTAILLGGNTGPHTLDPSRTGQARIADNPSSWTDFANVLYVDARGTGFSYGIAEGAENEAVRAEEMSARNFNSFVDAADLVRVVLSFLRERPALRALPVVLAGESYGGIRTSVALHMVHHPERYGSGAEPYEDTALAAEIAAHFEDADTTAAAQWSRAVLLQPRLSSPHQQAAAGAALEAEGSPLFAVAAETGVPFVPCADKPAPCAPFENALAFLAAANRDVYDVRKPAGDAFARYGLIGERLEDPAVLPTAIGVDPKEIAELSPGARADAYRLVKASADAEPLSASLGALAPYDRYFEIELFDLIGAPFAGVTATSLGIERQNARYGLYFLEDLLSVRFFVTNAAFDAVIWTPSLPAALQMYTSEVASVHMDAGSVTVGFVPGAFGLGEGESRSFRLAPFDGSGHSVSLDEPEALAADVGSWLAE